MMKTFDELVTEACRIILEHLMVGKFRDGVYLAVDMVVRWTEGNR